jgi:NADP-dependent 3-hydroxy acid dehydrogenase YdfG
METRDVVVITGASAGVGRATARLFARQGADVGLIARGRDGLEAAREEVERCGRRACVAVADVASRSRWRPRRRRSSARSGRSPAG